MKKGGVVVENWKVSVFEKHLNASEFAFTKKPGPITGTTMFVVECQWAKDLNDLCLAATAECKSRMGELWQGASNAKH